MSYRIYHTDAIVLRSFPDREADKSLVLFTEDFGLIYARAHGVRYEKSKLRYALADLSRTQVALVRGKAGWRVTGAVAASAASGRTGLVSLGRIASLVRRLVHGEERNTYLFGTLAAAHARIREGADPELVEIVSVSRILHALGYIAPSPADAALFSDDAFADAALEQLRASVPQHVRRINDTLAATQL